MDTHRVIESPVSRAGSLHLLGGALCLDFTNTSSGRGSPARLEHLGDYGDLLVWSRHAGTLTGAAALALSGRATECPAEAARVLSRARALREALHRLFAAAGGGAAPDGADLEALNREVARAMARGRIGWSEGVFAWGWHGRDTLDSPLWPVVQSAVVMLTTIDLRRVKLCPGQGCGWLFLDLSPNRSRRWCDMAVCGNRAKARRHYGRSKRG